MAELRWMALGARQTHQAGTGDMPSVDMDMIKPTNSPENVSTPQKKTKPPDSPIKAARQCPDGPNNFGNPMDVSIVCMDAQSIADNVKTAENEMESVSMCQNGSKTPNSPVEAARQCPDSPNNVGHCMVRLREHKDTHSIGNDAQMAVNEMENVRMHQI